MQSHKDLTVWQKSMDLVVEVYKFTKTLPREELYGLSSQMRRASITIPNNIAEGYQRNHIKEYIQFLHIAKGSASEFETQLTIAKRLDLGLSQDLINVENLLTEVLKMLNKLTSRLNNKQLPPNP